MGGFLGAVGGLGGIKELVLGVLDRIKLNPEEKAKIQAQMDQNSFELAKLDAELRQKQADQVAAEIETASANIRAELATGDRYTSRMRPTLGYVVYAVVIFNFILLPVVQLIRGVPMSPLELPGDLYWLFGAGYLGYSGFRSLDKGSFDWARKGKR